MVHQLCDGGHIGCSSGSQWFNSSGANSEIAPPGSVAQARHPLGGFLVLSCAARCVVSLAAGTSDPSEGDSTSKAQRLEGIGHFTTRCSVWRLGGNSGEGPARWEGGGEQVLEGEHADGVSSVEHQHTASSTGAMLSQYLFERAFGTKLCGDRLEQVSAPNAAPRGGVSCCVARDFGHQLVDVHHGVAHLIR